jgi:hypothetical protein
LKSVSFSLLVQRMVINKLSVKYSAEQPNSVKYSAAKLRVGAVLL